MRDSIQVHDQMHRPIILKQKPRRIISLVPSLTELLVDGFYLESCMAGVTDYCMHPSGIKDRLPVIGGPKSLNLKQIEAIEPDVVIASKEENVREQVEALSIKMPVFVTDVVDIPSALEAIGLLGELLAREAEAEKLIDSIQSSFAAYQPVRQNLSVAYLIWQAPFMAVSSGTFIHEMLTMAGFRNVFANNSQRYPQIALADLATKQPDLIFLSSEPYDFTEEDRQFLKDQLPRSQVVFVDGEMFSWYGNRMRKAPAYFKQLFKFVV